MKGIEYFISPLGVLLIISALLTYLGLKRNKGNQFHLDYILAHLLALGLMVGLYLFIGIFGNSPQIFSLIIFFHIVSMIAFSLHVESAIKGHQANLNFIYAIPLIAYLLVNVLNGFDLYLLNYPTNKKFFLGLEILDAYYFSDKKLIKDLAIGFIISRTIIVSSRSIDKSLTIKKKRIFKLWIYSYGLLVLLMHLSSALYYFDLLGAGFENIFVSITKITTMLSPIFILINPGILHYLPRINEIAIFTKVKKENYFEMINSLMEQEMLYLNTGLTINKLAVKTGISAKNIRASILVATEKNFTDYINHFRVQKAAALLEENYLSKHTTVALSEASGFNSHQSFFRAFKKVYRTTPALFARKIGANLK
jgi:AraC-like DNA-binding protein